MKKVNYYVIFIKTKVFFPHAKVDAGSKLNQVTKN